MPKGNSLIITPAAAAELSRQAAVAGTPGNMHIDLREGTCERWTIRLRPGHLAGQPVARADGVTLYAPKDDVNTLVGLRLDYKSDLSGGGFLVRSGNGIRSCACGAAFSWIGDAGRTTK